MTTTASPNPVLFKRVAITPAGVAQSETAFAAWAQNALQRGADAVLLRSVEPALFAPLAAYCKAWAPVMPVLLSSAQWPPANTVSVPDGLHLKSTAPWVLAGRASMFSSVVGRSCHTLEDCLRAQAEGYDYVFLSPVFQTATHPASASLGIDAFAAIVQQLSIPVFALGGLTPEREAVVRACGAHGVAAIGWFQATGIV